ncbi:MAG: hypothetical protein LBK42_01900 [Propionibacteriaceae bacterium]|jgi:hypothetical protein|nr:hypothetical protein [Propionibacteriaceae bacterium]
MTGRPATTFDLGLTPAEPVAAMTNRPVANFDLGLALAEPAGRPPR